MTPLIARRAAAMEATLRHLAEVKRLGAEDIGPKLGIAPVTALRYLRLLGIDFPTNGRKVFRLDRTGWDKDVPQLYRQGVPTKEIARRKGVSTSSVYRYLANGGHITVRERDTYA